MTRKVHDSNRFAVLPRGSRWAVVDLHSGGRVAEADTKVAALALMRDIAEQAAAGSPPIPMGPRGWIARARNAWGKRGGDA